MKKLLATILLSLPMMAFADPSAYRSMIPEIPGANTVYDAYIENGYSPVDSMILTNWDIMVGLNSIMGGKEVDEKMAKDVQNLRDSYKDAK